MPRRNFTSQSKDIGSTVFDSSIEHELLDFTIVKEELITGLEDTVMGMYLKDRKTFALQAEQTYSSTTAEGERTPCTPDRALALIKDLPVFRL
ncbi:FKBP-type peptidyl-prolyl cis-trans isomerase [Planctomycetota bacterium]